MTILRRRRRNFANFIKFARFYSTKFSPDNPDQKSRDRDRDSGFDKVIGTGFGTGFAGLSRSRFNPVGPKKIGIWDRDPDKIPLDPDPGPVPTIYVNFF